MKLVAEEAVGLGAEEEEVVVVVGTTETTQTMKMLLTTLELLDPKEMQVKGNKLLKGRLLMALVDHIVVVAAVALATKRGEMDEILSSSFDAAMNIKGAQPSWFYSPWRPLPNYIVSESEVEASKEGRRLADFRKLLVDKRSAVHLAPAHAHTREAPPLGHMPVIVDFTSILKRVRNKVGFQSDQETINHGNSRFTSWITITYPPGSLTTKTIFSTCSASIEDARNNLTKRVIEYLIPLYNLEIFDVNYSHSGFAKVSFTREMEKESYISMRSRVLGIEDVSETSPYLIPEECLTPRGKASKIPRLNNPPPNPKKKKENVLHKEAYCKTRAQHWPK
ncbi:hypothetical protein KSS87_017728 [Heliosperma pusillum]|nr:hypothetical protein KSS87_017728 [Heliosperma pusillum]